MRFLPRAVNQRPTDRSPRLSECLRVLLEVAITKEFGAGELGLHRKQFVNVHAVEDRNFLEPVSGGDLPSERIPCLPHLPKLRSRPVEIFVDQDELRAPSFKEVEGLGSREQA